MMENIFDDVVGIPELLFIEFFNILFLADVAEWLD
jgi:hypothetical protein